MDIEQMLTLTIDTIKQQAPAITQPLLGAALVLIMPWLVDMLEAQEEEFIANIQIKVMRILRGLNII